MTRLLKVFAVVLVFAGFATLSLAETAPSKADAKALTEKAAAFFKANGKDAGLAELAKKDGQFCKGPQLFAFALDLNGNVLAHPFNPALVGKDMTKIQDVDGKFFAAEMGSVGSKGSGWVEYKFTNPATKKTEPKATYVQREGDVIIACGIYVK